MTTTNASNTQTQNLSKLVREGGFKGNSGAPVPSPPSRPSARTSSSPRPTASPPRPWVLDAAIPTQFNRDPSQLVYRTIDVSMAGSGKCEVIVVAATRELVDRLNGACRRRQAPARGHAQRVRRDPPRLRLRQPPRGRPQPDHALPRCRLRRDQDHDRHGKEMSFAGVVNVGGKHLDDLAADQLACMRDQARRLRLALNAEVPTEPVPVTAARVESAARQSCRGIRSRASRRTGPAGLHARSAPSKCRFRRRAEEADLSELLETLTDEIQMCVLSRVAVPHAQGRSRPRGRRGAPPRPLPAHRQGPGLPAQAADPMARVARSGKEPAFGIDLKAAPAGLGRGPWPVPEPH